MGHEYLAPGFLPWGDDESELERVIGRRVNVIGHEWPDDDLLVSVFPAHGPDAERGRRVTGADVNVMLVFTDVAPTSEATLRRGVGIVLRALTELAKVQGARLLVLEELNDSSLIASLDGGEVTLNDLWPGWLEWPDLAEGHKRAELHLPNG